MTSPLKWESHHQATMFLPRWDKGGFFLGGNHLPCDIHLPAWIVPGIRGKIREHSSNNSTYTPEAENDWHLKSHGFPKPEALKFHGRTKNQVKHVKLLGCLRGKLGKAGWVYLPCLVSPLRIG